MATKTKSVRQLIAELRNEGLIDPSDMVARLLDGMIDDPWEALAEVLPHYVVTHRNDLPVQSNPEAKSPVIHSAGNYSPRLAAARRIFGRSEFVNGRYKTLGSCSLSDIDWLVSDKLKRAAELEDSGKRYSRLRDAMVRHGVSQVRELPEDLVEKILD